MATDVTYGRHGKYVTMRSSYFANFERSCCERRAKLLRTSSEVAANVEQSCCKHRAKLLRTSSKVAANIERSCYERRAKLLRTSSEVETYLERSYVDHALLRSCTHSVQVRISLWKWRRLSQFCGEYAMSKFSEYKRQRDVPFGMMGSKPPQLPRF